MALPDHRRHFKIATMNSAGHTAAKGSSRNPQLARNGDITETSRSQIASPVMIAIATAHRVVWSGVRVVSRRALRIPQSAGSKIRTVRSSGGNTTL